MFLLCFSIFATILGVKGECSLIERPKLNYICSADVLCEGTTEDLEGLKRSWRCIRSDKRYYNQFSNTYDYGTVDNYKLYVNVTNIDINISEDPLAGIDVGGLTTLNIMNGNLVSVPIIISKLLSLVKLNELSITYNNIESINLHKLSGVVLVSLNVSHNCINHIEYNRFEETTFNVTSIDLSYNALESLPDNCFEIFSYLKYLDLSFNNLKQFEILTFEGITHLETLKLANNKISDIGQNFARFRNLKDLDLDFNQLTSLTDVNFRTLTSLEKLNLSSNLIKHVDDQTLSTLTNLKQLDLSHNKIIFIHQSLFKNNNKMYELSLSHNHIEKIDGGAFKNTSISTFDIQNNYMRGSIEYDTFLGISVESLDLSKGSLKELGEKAFSPLSKNLKYLNLSSNLIEDVTESAFQSLLILSKLDLSYNRLVNIDFNTSDLQQLTEYYLQNNILKRITPKMFKNMTRLEKLDLSQNKIDNIDLNSFIDLVNLRELNLSSNNFVDSFKQNTFQDLYRVKTLDLSNTRSVSCLNQSFSGMIVLTYLNLSHSQLHTIEYETFKATGAIKLLDLSYNLLEKFHINTSSISQLSKLYLNHNKLKNITNETFKNLHLLEQLSLACNHIINIDSSGLRISSHLHYLYLFSNNNLHFKSDVFNNLSLSILSLTNVRQQFDFENALNASVSTLILSNCEIDDINSVFVYKIRNVFKLDASSNRIKNLDKKSFQNMDTVVVLDLSYNVISTIQPGTFLTNKMINTLNLYSNYLESLQFGVLDGLGNLRVLNLSNNNLHIFAVNLLHTSPFLTELFLENNNLERMDFRALSNTRVKFLTIGGNRISCDELANWIKMSNDELNVTAENISFDSENIHGINCKTNNSWAKVDKEITNLNVTSNVNKIKETVGELYSYLRLSLNETLEKVLAVLEQKSENVGKVLPNSNPSQMVFNEQLVDLLNGNKEIMPRLVKTNENVANEIKLMISLLEINNNLTQLGNSQRELLRTSAIENHENNNSADIVPINAGPLEVKSDTNILVDIKSLLYFIASCLLIVILFCLVAIIYYKYFFKLTSQRTPINHLYDGGQSVRTCLEME